MKIYRAYKTELDLNNKQRSACLRHAGAARFTYNWALKRKMESYKAGLGTPMMYELSREVNRLKKTEFQWMYSVSNVTIHEALRHADQSFADFFRRLKQKEEGQQVKVGYPRFKSKKGTRKSFCLRDSITILYNKIKLPRLGWLRFKEYGYLPISGVKILSATLSERAERWFVSVRVEMEIPDPSCENKEPAVGIDLGVITLATLSDGMKIPNPKALKKSLQKIKQLQRVVSRRKLRSANRYKAAKKLARAYYRVTNVRQDAIHKATTWLAKTKSAVVLEDLNISGMVKNHYLALAISDAGMYEFRRQMLYKGKWYGCRVVLAPRFYPSTKRCSNCHSVKVSMELAERFYHCEHCGIVLDRDLNAAINLLAVIHST